MRPFAQPWAKEALQLKPHADADMVLLNGDYDLNGHADDTAPSLATYPGRPLEVGTVSKILYPAAPRSTPKQCLLWLV